MSRILPILLVLFSLLIAACGPDYIQEERRALPGGMAAGWAHADSIVWEIPIEDTSIVYDLSLRVEHSAEFPFENLYVNIGTFFPDDGYTSQPLSIPLADTYGGWLGDCSRGWCTREIPIQQRAFFDRTGLYKISVAQFMRQDTMPGVRALTFLRRRASPVL